MYKDIICGTNNIKGEGIRHVNKRAERLHSIETNFVLFKLDCYKFKMLIVTHCH